ncbi:MAG: YggS family pyridoxal phosphate-dependent enzyme [Clostridiales bacterium]|jgi:pyridoxal phosphate enzyme (YggS family)|nr:YggS family pyridoxal phosphate-dependent enzyme [Clostridiales bacterium]
MMEKSFNREQMEQRCRQLEENLAVIRQQVRDAARRSGRSPEEITLLAATKTVPVEIINHGISLGITHIGENKVQELCEKYDHLDFAHCHCQFIGHLQTNKVKQLIGKVEMIQSVGSLKLAREISRICQNQGVEMDVLIEVNIGREENKSGVMPEELESLIVEAAQLPAIHIQGLMTIPPISETISKTKEYFSNMYKKFIDIKGKTLDNVNMKFLSMGMSADYVTAIEAGANIVRVGSALFGARAYPAKDISV